MAVDLVRAATGGTDLFAHDLHVPGELMDDARQVAGILDFECVSVDAHDGLLPVVLQRDTIVALGEGDDFTQPWLVER